MSQQSAQGESISDFFISYVRRDERWAEWIAAQLEQAGQRCVLEVWDFRSGQNLLLEIDRALKTAGCVLVVLSPAYMQDALAQTQWAAAYQRALQTDQVHLLPVRVEEFALEGLLGGLIPIDLFGLDEAGASARLLSGLIPDRLRPASVPFPGLSSNSAPFAGRIPKHWNIPYYRNPFFTGREVYLQTLRTCLQQGEAIGQKNAISGLGGIGKTQLAVEYAYRHRSAYDAVLWVDADTTESLMGSYSELARQLQLPDCDAQEQERVVHAVKDWLRKERNYLLILDNADTPSLLHQFIPPDAGGHLLITTRAATIAEAGLGLAAPLIMEALDPDTGAQLLLRRANLLTTATPPDQELVCLLSIELGGLPLALDQAGAYIASKQTSLARYQQLYQQHRLKLLRRRNNQLEHPEPVVTTWDISFRAVEETDPAAANLLRFCAFLAPSGIPECILTTGTDGLAPVFVDELLLDEAIGILRSYSLIERDSESGMLTMHRLVQEVVREGMEEKEQIKWAARAMGAIVVAYPDDPDVASWPIQEQLLPHALQCAFLAEVLSLAVVVAHLLNRVGNYLSSRARYEEAEPLHVHALATAEQEWGAEHPMRAACMNDLALLYVHQGRYEEAEPLYVRALAIFEKELGTDHPNMAMGLNNLAALYMRQGRYGEAEQLCKQGLDLSEKALGTDHPNTAMGLNNLVEIYKLQGRYEEAEPLLKRALAIQEHALGADYPNTATFMSNLAEIYDHQGKQREAEQLQLRALDIRERKLGANHPQTVQSLQNLAGLYIGQGRYKEAEPLLKRTLAIQEQESGANHLHTANSLIVLAYVHKCQERYEEAEPLYNCAHVAEKTLSQG